MGVLWRTDGRLAGAGVHSVNTGTMRIRKRTLRRWSVITMGGLIFLMALSHMGAKMLHVEWLAAVTLTLEAAGFWIQDLIE